MLVNFKKLAFALNAKDVNAFSFSSEDSLIAEKQVIYVGSFYQEVEDEWFDVQESDLDNFIVQHDRMLSNGIEVPMPEEHNFMPSDRRGKVLSYYKGLDDKGRVSLFARVEFKDAQTKRDFKDSQVSLYSPPVFVDGQKNSYPRAITHLALTDYPVVPDLGTWKTIAASAKPKTKDKPMLMKQLAVALSLQPADDATEESLVEMITAHFSAMNKTAEDNKTLVASLSAEIETLKANPNPANPPAPEVSPAMLSMMKENRTMKLSTLTEAGRISPVVKTALEDLFASDSAVTMAFSNTPAAKSSVATFDKVIDALSKNEITSSGEGTGPQTLKFSSQKEGDNSSSNVLTRMAENKAEAQAN